ncbi:MAG: hypothetical protein ACE5HB_08130 [Terriglobia bacterium]
MSATVVSFFILGFSAFGLLLWLRSAARSVLAHRFEQDYSTDVAEANQLEYLEVRRLLGRAAGVADYQELLTALQRDYEALTYLLRNAATLHVGRYTRAERLLILDFHLLRLWVGTKRAVGAETWRANVQEMVSILEYFGNVVGQRLVTFPSRVPTT